MHPLHTYFNIRKWSSLPCVDLSLMAVFVDTSLMAVFVDTMLQYLHSKCVHMSIIIIQLIVIPPSIHTHSGQTGSGNIYYDTCILDGISHVHLPLVLCMVDL